MDPFVKKLVQRLLDPSQPLSRNRHFHTFQTPEGQAALKVSRRLRSLQRDILACRDEGHPAQFVRHETDEGDHLIELRLQRIAGRRTSRLGAAEFELLSELPGVRQVLVEATPR